METKKAFSHGYDIGLDAIDSLAEIFEGKHDSYFPDAYAGLFKSLMTCLYCHAPNHDAADALIDMAREWSKQDPDRKKT